MKEEWRPISQDTRYLVSNFGNIKSTRTGILMKQRPSRLGNYPSVVLAGKSYFVHRLVAIAFLENPNGFKNVNHKDESRTNNRVDNLEWCTQGYNVQYGSAELRRRATYDSNLSNNKLVKRVVQYDSDWNVIKVWPSVRKAARELGLNHSEISRACCGKRNINHCGGFKWKYENAKISSL